jgi:hypothetical protein
MAVSARTNCPALRRDFAAHIGAILTTFLYPQQLVSSCCTFDSFRQRGCRAYHAYISVVDLFDGREDAIDTFQCYCSSAAIGTLLVLHS